MHLTSITTLDAAKQQLKISSIDVGDDDLLRVLLDVASGMVTRHTGRHFVPLRAVRTYDARGEHVDSRDLDLDADLLQVVSITNGDGSTVPNSNCALKPANTDPKWRIRLTASSNLSWAYQDDWEDAIAIDGIWGYHSDYARAWVDTRDTVQNTGGIDAAATTLDVSDADGKDAQHRPRFAVGQVLRIEDEFVEIAEVDTVTNRLTILRGVLGTTAAAHDADTAIHSWSPLPDIAQACISLVAWLYRTGQKPGERYTFLNSGTTVQIHDAPLHIRQTLQAYQRWELP